MNKTSVVTPGKGTDPASPDAEDEAAGAGTGDTADAGAESGDTAESGETVESGDAAENGEAAPSAESGTAAGKSGRSWRRWLPRPVTAVLIVLLVVAVVFAAVFGWKLAGRNDRNAAGQAALGAAQNYAVALTSIDYQRLDGDVGTILDGATGQFKDMYSQSSAQLKPLLQQAKSVSKGHVVAASVQSATENHAVIMLFVDAEITNVTNPEPRIDRNRILMTMEKVGDRWLASKVELP